MNIYIQKKIQELTATIPMLQEMLKEILIQERHETRWKFKFIQRNEKVPEIIKVKINIRGFFPYFSL